MMPVTSFEALKGDSVRREAVRGDIMRQENMKIDSVRQEPGRLGEESIFKTLWHKKLGSGEEYKVRGDNVRFKGLRSSEIGRPWVGQERLKGDDVLWTTLRKYVQR